jgi:hypothetical protein
MTDAVCIKENMVPLLSGMFFLKLRFLQGVQLAGFMRRPDDEKGKNCQIVHASSFLKEVFTDNY